MLAGLADRALDDDEERSTRSTRPPTIARRVTADRKPHEISDIADRLRTRFAWGLLADIEPPELEVRIAILRKKAAVESVSLPDDVAMYIAAAITSNVRELHHARECRAARDDRADAVLR